MSKLILFDIDHTLINTDLLKKLQTPLDLPTMHGEGRGKVESNTHNGDYA